MQPNQYSTKLRDLGRAATAVDRCQQGIPTADNTHEVAQAIAPESRAVHVDYDLIVMAHARALLTAWARRLG
jgi:hypothetical protein